MQPARRGHLTLPPATGDWNRSGARDVPARSAFDAGGALRKYPCRLLLPGCCRPGRPALRLAAAFCIGLWTLDFGLWTRLLDSGNTSWKSLFAGVAAGAAKACRLEVLVFHRAGEPLLVLPRGDPRLASALDLYPAQTLRARLAKAAWRQMIRW